MAVPSQVAKAAEEADQWLKSGGKKPDEPGEIPDSEGKPDEKPSTEEPTAPKPAEKPQEQPPVAPIAADGDPNSETWKSRFETLQGKYNREIKGEVPVLKSRITSLEEQNRNLNAYVRQMEKARSNGNGDSSESGKPPEGDSSNQDDIFSGIVSDEQREEYGPEFMEMIHLMAKRVADREIEPMRRESAQNTVKSFKSEMNRLVPEWEDLNTDPAFLQWLETETDMLGNSFTRLLDVAVQDLDAQKVARFFKTYLDKSKTAPKPSTPADALEDQVLPDTESARTPKPLEERVFTVSEINAFYTDVTKGRFRNRPEEKRRMNAEINRALKEGRVRDR